MNLPVIHGDVSFHPVSELPKGLKKLKSENRFVVQHGESGHKHVMVMDRPADVEIYLDPKTSLHVFDVKNQVTVEHEEHQTLTIAPGIYIQKQENEYDPFEAQLRKVMD